MYMINNCIGAGGYSKVLEATNSNLQVIYYISPIKTLDS